MSDEKLFSEARSSRTNSTCLKTQTGAIIVKNGALISRGANLCAPDGQTHGQAVFSCPRMAIKTGAGYELCRPIHAEVMACLNVRNERTQEELARFASHLEPSTEEILTAFRPEELSRLAGATLYLVGHYWACEGCKRLTKTLGISEIKFDPITGEETKSRYETGGLAKQ